MPDGLREIHKSGCHALLSTGLLYHVSEEWRKGVFTWLSLGWEWEGVEARLLAADLASLGGTGEAPVPTWFGGGTGNVEDRHQ